VVIVAVLEGIVVVFVSGGLLSGVGVVVVGEGPAAVVAAAPAVLPSNARPRRINISRSRVEPAFPRSCARSRWRPAPVLPGLSINLEELQSLVRSGADWVHCPYI